MLDLPTIISICVFLAISILVGLVSSRKESLEGFLIGDRSLNTFTSIMTLCGTFVGAMTFMVYTAFVYTFGISAIWIFIGYFLGFIVFIPFALYLKRFSDGKNFYTIVDYFNSKFGRKTALLVVSLIFTWYFGTLSAQFIGGGKVLSELTGINYYVSAIVMCAVIMFYLILGGFQSVVKTDVFQFAILFIIIIIAAMSLRFGSEIPVELFNPFNAGPVNIIAFLVLGLLTPFATQDYWQKVFAMKDETVVKRSFFVSAFLVFFLSIFLTYIGLVARENFPNIDPDMAVLYSFTKLIPQSLKAFTTVAFFAAILSTADTFLFLLSINFVNDFRGLNKKNVPEKQLKNTVRKTLFVIGVLSLVLALLVPSIVDVAIVFKAIGLTISPIVLIVWLGGGKRGAIHFSIVVTFIFLVVLVAFKFIRPELLFVSMFGSAIFYGLYRGVSAVMPKKTEGEA